MKLNMHEMLDASNIRITKDGYLAATVRAARAGIQIYRGYEVGDPKMKEVRVYRPPDEVFHKDSLATYPHKPITNDHPPVMVDSESWKKYAVGAMGESVARDGEFVVVPMALMDQDVIDDYRKGKRQLSMGYTCELVFDAGVTPDGQEYDAVQRNIRANHLAVVAVARGGPDLKIGDDDDEQGATMQKHLVDGISVEMSDTAIQVVQKAFETRGAALSTAKSELKTAQDALAKAQADGAAKTAADAKTISEQVAEIAVLKKKVEDSTLTPKQIDALVAERQTIIGKAQAVLGDKLVIDGKSVGEIRRQVVDAYLGDDAKGYNDDQVTIAFGVVTKDAKGDNKTNGRDALSDALSSRKTPDTRDAAYADYDKALTNAWKNKPAAVQ